MPIFLGDFRYFWPENISDFVHLPSAWDASLNTGIGKSSLSSLWINSFLNFTALFSKLGLSWEWISLIFWILPAIIISFLSSFLLFNYLFNKKKYSFLSGIVYTLNTYFLMIVTGGQAGVALSYSLAPLALLTLIRILKTPTLKNSIVAGLILGLQILFDPRIFYITLFAFLFYLIFFFSDFIKVVRHSFFLFITPFIIAVFFHSYWLLPLLLTRDSGFDSGFQSVSGFEFFSFADFSHSLSLLHPNWPENIFGKIYFLDPKFLILPVIGFASLLFGKNRNILYFSTIALLGTFLAKGANPPFGEINKFLFEWFPGMIMFRDPTKFYLLIALSYSVLIPFSIYSLQELLISKIKYQKFNFSYAFLIFAILYLIFLIRPLWVGELRDKFKPKSVPNEYVQLKDFLYKQPQFFRTLWIPQWQRFGFFGNNHPAIGREEIFKGDSIEQVEQLKKEESLLRDLAVKYIIVPYDSEGELFLKDRRYDHKQYQKTIERLSKINWLKRVEGFSKSAVFEISNPRDHFWSPSTNLRIKYNFVRPTEYKVQVQSAKRGDLLVFSEGFDKNWQASFKSSVIRSKNFNGLNSFVLSTSGDSSLVVYYKPQDLVNTGLAIGSVTSITLLGLLISFRLRKMVK